MKSRITPAGSYQKIVKSISAKENKDKIGRLVYQSNLKSSINKCILKEIKRESIKLCSLKEDSILRDISSGNLAKFSLTTLDNEISQKAPVFHSFIKQFVKGSVLGTAVTLAVALKSRNKHMSAFHHIIGQILDHGGATDQVVL